jgi:DNA-binding transcriptional LysR family regulator
MVWAMELRPLRYFLAVVDSGSVTAASDVVRVAQPSLSRQLRQLESDLSLTLFDRRGGRLILSQAGRQFVPVARDLVARADAASAAATALAAGRMDRITIAAPPTTMTDVIAPFIATLRPDDPFPSVLERDPAAVHDTLRAGADLVISTDQPPTRYAALLLAVLPVWLYVRADHPLASKDEVLLSELAEQPLLVLPAGHKPRQLLDSAVEDSRLRLADITETGSAEIAQALAAAGRGLAVVTDDSRFGLHGLRIRTGPGNLVVHLHAAWDPDHHAAAAIASLAERISVFCVERYGADAAPPVVSSR